MVTASADPSLFPALRSGATLSTNAWNAALGVRIRLGSLDVLALRSDHILRLARDNQVMARLLERLREADVLLPGHGGKSTRQPATLRIGEELQRPRFWVLDAERLARLAKAQEG